MYTRNPTQLHRNRANSAIHKDVLNVDYINVRNISNKLNSGEKYIIYWLPSMPTVKSHFNTLGPRQNGRHFAEDTFKRMFLNENVRISLKISLKFVPKGPVNNNPALVQIMAWRRPGNKPLSETMMDSSLTHICVTRPQWVNRRCFQNEWVICAAFLTRNDLT